MLKKTVKLKTEWGNDANMYLQLITYTIKCSNSLQAMAAPLRKIGKKKGHFWMFWWWVWFFTHWSGATALVEKDEADSFHRWPQYNALPGRVKGCYSFRYPNKVQLRFWLIQIFFWKPNSREIDVPPLCEMPCRQPVTRPAVARHASTVSTDGYYLYQTFAWKRGRAIVSEGPYYRWLDRLNYDAGNILRYMIIVSCLFNAWSAAWFSPGDLGEICAEAALPAWMTSSLTIFRYVNHY